MIGEVKNVSYQSYTQQLRDYVAIAKDEDLVFVLYVRGLNGTRLSGPFQEAIEAGEIVLMKVLPIPGLAGVVQ